ncbi:MAG: CAP domain-containing protein [bacterium]
MLSSLAIWSASLGCGGRPEPAPPAPVPVQAPPPTPGPTVPSRVSVRAAASITDSIFALTNRERVRADLTPLRRSADLSRAAQVQAEQMASAQKLAHDLPGSRYPSLVSRLRLVKYTSSASGENIAEGYTSGAALVAGWMTSTTHKANILSARYTETGVGSARSKAGRTYHAQVFARRR